jgi:CubicO group peptidase (beta-lactamase class C family)
MNIQLPFRIHLTALTVCLFFAGSASAASGELEEKVDQLFSAWNKPHSPGAAVIVRKGGHVVYQREFGCASLEHDVSITAQTAFDAASVAKQFTGLAIAMLLKEGVLTLDDDIRKYLPDVPDFGEPIKIRHLLSHTSGLRDWGPALVLSGSRWSDLVTTDQIMELVRHQRELGFAPGEKDLYCNTGYNLLAAIVAKISGKPFPIWMKENIFQPLGMDNTAFYNGPGAVVPKLADSYEFNPGVGFVRQTTQVFAPGSSTLLTTIEDMGKWLANLETAKVGGTEALAATRKRGRLNSGKTINYGFGLFLEPVHGLEAESHGGGLDGYTSAVLHIPSKRFGVTILANRADIDSEALARKIAEIYLGLPHDSPAAGPAPESQPPKATEFAAPAREELSIYAGDYWSEELEVVYHVAIRDSNLVMRCGFRKWTPLVARSADQFETESIPELGIKAEIQFTRNAGGEVSGMKVSARRVRDVRFARVLLPRFDVEKK